MQRMQGLLHQTSFQVAQHPHPASEEPGAVTGQKRSWSDSYSNSDPQQATPNGHVRFQRASALPNTPSRLTPSSIIQLQHALGDSEYSQREKFAATPSSTRDPELSLSHPLYALPEQLVANFATLGINHIYPWQKNCLKGPGLLTGERNLVYCAPTGGGKSLIADCEPILLPQKVYTS